MRVLVSDIVVGEESTFLTKHFDDHLIAGEDVLADEFRDADFFRVVAASINGRKDVETVFATGLVIVRAMTGGDVDLASSRVCRDEERVDDFRGARHEGMLRLKSDEFFAFEHGKFVGQFVARLGFKLGDEGLRDDVNVSCGFSVGVFADDVVKVGMQSDGEVRGKRPRRGRPDDEGGVGEFSRHCGTSHDLKVHINRWRYLVLILDFGFCQSRACAVAPEHRALHAVDEILLNELGEGAHDIRFVSWIKREIGLLPVREDTKALEAVALDVDVFAGVFLGFLADFNRAKSGAFFNHAEFDGQSMAVPTRHERGVIAEHGLGFDDEIFEDLVQRCAHVDIAIGKGRAVVKDELLRAFALGLDTLIKPGGFPFGKAFRLPFREAGPHREIRDG